MGYIILTVCIIVALTIVAVVYLKTRMTVEKQELIVVGDNNKIAQSLVDDYSANEMIVMVEQLPVETIENESKLMEITDSKVLARVNNLVPGLVQVGNAVNNASQAVKENGEVLYRAIIPAGAKLTDSKAMEGAFRGFYRGTDGIRGHANLVAVEAQKGTSAVVNTTAAAMGVASMIVGQYYMNQINTELTEISDGILKIADFQDNEYKSKVFALNAQVKKITSFQVEVLENQELREAEITKLNSLEHECIVLLGQANLTIADFAKKKDLDYDQYEKELNEAQKWYAYQRTLLETLYKMEDLRYILHLGAVSREQCSALLPAYIKQVQDAQRMLTSWHEDTTKRLGIETTSARRKRDGFDGVIHWLPGLFNEDYNFRSISAITVSMIETQSSGYSTEQKENADLFKKDVQLIVKDGKVYYLPSENSD